MHKLLKRIILLPLLQFRGLALQGLPLLQLSAGEQEVVLVALTMEHPMAVVVVVAVHTVKE